MNKKYSDDYKNPWETSKEGFWIVHKHEGCTSISKINDPATMEIEAALAQCYDIVVERIMKFRNENEVFSASDLTLDTIKGLRQIINNKSLTPENE